MLSFLKALFMVPVYFVADIVDSYFTLWQWCRYPNFRKADIRCLKAHMFSNPHKICNDYAAPFSEEVVQKEYGETPFSVYREIAKTLQLQPDDVVYDLGSGRGRGVFYLHGVYQCAVYGIDINPTFTRKATAIAEQCDFSKVHFLQASMMELMYQDATVIYLYGSAMTEAAVVNLMQCLKHLPTGVKVVSASYALDEYQEDWVNGQGESQQRAILKQDGKFVARFPWGMTYVYLHTRS